MKKTALFITLVAGFTVFACSNAKQEKEDVIPSSPAYELAQAEGWQLLDTMGYEVALPGNWGLVMNRVMGTEFISIAELDTAHPEFRTNINYIRQDISTHRVTLDEYTDFSIEQFKASLQNCEIRAVTRLDDYHEITYAGQQGDQSLVFYQRYFLRNDTVHILTATASGTVFDDHEDLFRICFDSFKLKGTDEKN